MRTAAVIPEAEPSAKAVTRFDVGVVGVAVRVGVIARILGRERIASAQPQ